MRSTFEVTDLFKSAFLPCMGARLDKVQVRNNGRKIATFLITGPDLEKLDNDYRTGRALVNPLQLRESLNHLRDIMFEKLRENDPASSRLWRGYAATRGRETRGQAYTIDRIDGGLKKMLFFFSRRFAFIKSTRSFGRLKKQKLRLLRKVDEAQRTYFPFFV